MENQKSVVDCFWREAVFCQLFDKILDIVPPNICDLTFSEIGFEMIVENAFI